MSDDYEEITIEDGDAEETPYVLPETYWLTRDRKHGVLSDRVEVWAVKPERIRFPDGDIMWMAPLELIDVVETRLTSWSVEKCPTAPDDDRMCVRVGEEPVVITAS